MDQPSQSVPPIIIKSFHFEELSAKWIQPSGLEGVVDFSCKNTIWYDVLDNNSDEHLKGMNLHVSFESKDKFARVAGYQIAARIFGEFRVENPVSGDEAQLRFRILAFNALYGILRGAIAGLTAQFPPGQVFMVPTVSPIDVFNHVEQRRAQQAVHLRTSDKDKGPNKNG